MIMRLGPLVDRLTGPAGNVIAHAGPRPGTAILKLRKKRPEIHHLSPTVKAFQLADKIYKEMSECERHLWRSAQRDPCKSGYDCWMTYAGANIARGYLPPTIPPAPGGFRRGLAPPGPKWYDFKELPCLPNQTCHGPVAWDWSWYAGTYVNFETSLDLRHPDDSNPFNVTLSRWLLYDNDARSWVFTDVERTVPNNFHVYNQLGPYPPPTNFSNVGVIEIRYANLHQRFVIVAGQILPLPLELCSSPAFTMAQTAHSETAFIPGMTHFWRAPDCRAYFLCTSWDDSSPRHGTRRRLRAMASVIERHGGNSEMANIHVRGLKMYRGDRYVFDEHCWQYEYLAPYYWKAPPYRYGKTGRTIMLLDGTAFSMPWIENEKHVFTMVLPPETPEKP